MVCSTLLRFSASPESVTFRESVRFSVKVTFLVCTDFLYTVLYWNAQWYNIFIFKCRKKHCINLIKCV